MPYHCVAYGCGKTAEDGVTLFKFPKDPEEFRKWEKQVLRTRPHWVATPNSYLCSEHFGKEYFEPRHSPGALKLRTGAAPTVFVRPHCSSCSGVGCIKCLPAIQRRSITAETRERTTSSEKKEMAPVQFDDANGGSDKEPPAGGAAKPGEKNGEGQPVVCEMCGTTGSVSTFFSKSKRFCSTSCSRSYSSNSKKSSILARLNKHGRFLAQPLLFAAPLRQSHKLVPLTDKQWHGCRYDTPLIFIRLRNRQRLPLSSFSESSFTDLFTTSTSDAFVSAPLRGFELEELL